MGEFGRVVSLYAPGGGVSSTQIGALWHSLAPDYNIPLAVQGKDNIRDLAMQAVGYWIDPKSTARCRGAGG
jgi:hypothetical protein